MHPATSSGHWPAVAVAAVVAGGFVAFDPGGWQAFGPLKWAVVTVAALVAGAAAVWRGVRVHRPSAVAWMTVLGWAAIVSITALDPLAAWIGTPDRRLGWAALLTMAAAYLAGQAVTTPGQRRLVGRAVVGTLIVLGGYGLAEAVGATPLDLDVTTARLGATFGSAAYLAGAVVLILPVAVAVAGDRSESLRWRSAGAAAAAFGVGLLAGSGTRAGLVGMIAAAAVTAPAWWPVFARRRLALVVVGLTTVALLWLSPLGQRMVDQSEDGFGRGRLDEWAVAGRALAARPLLGTGLEGYRVVFPEVVEAGYVQQYGRTTVTDRAHSGPLDLALPLGVVGLAVWLAAAGFLVNRAVTVVAAREPVATGLAAGLVAFLAQQLLLFPAMELDVGAWALAGVMVASTAGSRSYLRSRPAGAVLAALAAIAFLAGGADVAADRAAGRGLAEGSIVAADRAVSLRPDSFRYHLAAAEVARRRGDLSGSLERVDRALRLSPRDPALRLARGRLLTEQAVRDGVGVEEAIVFGEELAATDPAHPEVHLLLGRLLVVGGRLGEAERAWLTAEFLAPTDVTAPIELARLYLSLDRREAAHDAIARAEAIAPASPELDALRRRADEP